PTSPLSRSRVVVGRSAHPRPLHAFPTRRSSDLLMASAAILMLPSVPFLSPTGHDRPEASSRCTCDSVVRAPIAPQLTRSAIYCGDRKSTRLNSSHVKISYAVFCLKKKKRE